MRELFQGDGDVLPLHKDLGYPNVYIWQNLNGTLKICAFHCM